MSFLFVGDGARDDRTIPPIVATILGRQIEGIQTRHWSKLRFSGGSGYDRKLNFVMREAIDAGLKGVVATVDRDKSPTKSRLSALNDGRTRARENTKAPALAVLAVALGEANPHAEAWLLDDEVAVRETLIGKPDLKVPNVLKVKYPKDDLDELIDSARADDDRLEVLAEIASRVQHARCPHRDDTGLAAFAKEVLHELGRDRERRALS